MEEKNIFIVRCGEVALKGLNKPYFEKTLAESIRKAVARFDGIEVKRHEGLIFVKAPCAVSPDILTCEISKVFGVDSVSPALEVETELERISEAAVLYMSELFSRNVIKTFKVKAKRADKDFPVLSPDIAKIIGAKVLTAFPSLAVDVHDPDCNLYVDVRKGKSYIYDEKISGFGGLPAGTNGKGLVLLSGGIDSPVAAFMMARRGMMIEAVHFHSFPYTSERAQRKVEELAAVLASYCGKFRLHIVNLLPIQEEIVKRCPEDEMTILIRRFMMKIAEEIAKDNGCDMLITGENLGQVASQTAGAIVVTNAAVNMPVMRPLIAFDKADIIKKAQEIGTFDISIEPYEDCCTVFLPKHPVTKPRLSDIVFSEDKLDACELIKSVLNNKKIIAIKQK